MSKSATAGEVLATRRPASIQFNHPQEFLAELHRDRAWIHRGIVRVTRQYRSIEPDTSHELSVVAGYLMPAGLGTRQLVELRRVCGVVRGLDNDAETEQLAERTIGEIEQAIADARLVSRPGRLTLSTA